jgi:hypothetical protein
MKRPTAFEKIHRTEILGKLTLPDRVLFRGHLQLRDPRTLGIFLKHSHVMLKDFGAYAEARTAELKAHAERLAAEAGRPFLYLSSPHTVRCAPVTARKSWCATSPAVTACARDSSAC